MNLSEIKSPTAIKNMPENELQALAGEIREKIIRTVALNGGHLASNMGAVELTIALHRVLNCPKDKLVFDVGHQCYTHKILTGRCDRFSTLRKTDGICGFPRREESPFDAFDTGHASTAISAALGMARARDMKGESWRVLAVVGDGAMTGGMCYEALNDAGSSQIPMMVVLNDNGMSISRNVGALSRQLTKLRLSRGLARRALRRMVRQIGAEDRSWQKRAFSEGRRRGVCRQGRRDWCEDRRSLRCRRPLGGLFHSPARDREARHAQD